MSDAQMKRRIIAQSSASDPDIMGFVMEAIVQAGPPVRFDGPDAGAPLSQALFAVEGVRHVEVSAAAIWVRKDSLAAWDVLKPAIATAIRSALDGTDTPLGAPKHTDPDTALLRAVEELLDNQVNPSVAAHGGHIGAERVVDGTVYLRMSGGCQGCAASAATLRDGVERMLRSALPEIRQIVDVTDHAEGDNPFYAREGGTAPAFNRPVPPHVIDWDGEEIAIDPDYLAPRLGLSVEALLDGMESGAVTNVTEAGVGMDAGTSRIVFRSATRAWAAEVSTDGSAREIPPPRLIPAGAVKDAGLVDLVRAHLQGLPLGAPFITYGALARALGYWAPGSVARITRALEDTMREDVAAGRAFIAARAVSRGSDKQSARGFFDLARQLGCGPEAGESDSDFHARQILARGQ
jgi:Fe-S cluster biogenesis protein NfuA